ncbi:MAG: recombinase RecT, partial [Geminicoccaceae bacterium]
MTANLPALQKGFKTEVERLGPEIEKALPQSVKIERFQRVLVTAVNSDPDLLAADRNSLRAAIMNCAADGLVPDKREAAFVIFNTQDKKTKQWRKLVQYMPMVGGIIKRVRQSGDVSTIRAVVVYERDEFEYLEGDEPRIYHKPAIWLTDRGPVRGSYAISKLKDGELEREFVLLADIEKARATSKAPNSPAWLNWWTEQAKKVALRRLSKRLPTSGEMLNLMARDTDILGIDSRIPATPPADALPVYEARKALF